MSTVIIQKEISLVVGSGINAQNVSSDGSSFEIKLNQPLPIDANAINLRLSCTEANIWWTVPNIITGENDKFVIYGPNTSDVMQTFEITIPQGLYDLTDYTQTCQRQLEAANAKVNPKALVTFSPDSATSKVEMRLNYPNTYVDFRGGQNAKDILGFNALIVPDPVKNVASTIVAPNAARFNRVNYFLLHSSMVQDGIQQNGTYSQIISKVPITVRPGSQENFAPFNPVRIPVNHLSQNPPLLFRFNLTNDRNEPLNTGGETWGATIKIEWCVKA